MSRPVFIVVRHGSYDRDNKSLTEKGIKEMQEIARSIPKLDIPLPCNVALISSPAARAAESAMVISRQLSCDASFNCTVLDPLPILFSDGDKLAKDQPELAHAAVADNLKKQGTSDESPFHVVVIVSHYELAPYLVSWLLKGSGRWWDAEFGQIRSGKAVVVYADSSTKWLPLKDS